MDPNLASALLGLAWFAVFLMHLTAHEASHALAARLLGDSTAYDGGQVTLNPLPHMERAPFGTIVAPIATYIFTTLQSGTGFMIGWAHAPYNPHWAARYPKRSAAMALAGPMANLLIMFLAALVIRIGLAQGWIEKSQDRVIFLQGAGALNVLAQFLSITFFLGALLFLFNLIPVPPLDGSSIVQFFMSDATARRWQHFRSQPNIQIIGLIAGWGIFNRYGGQGINWMFQTLLP